MSQQETDFLKTPAGAKMAAPLKRGLLEFIVLKTLDAESLFADDLYLFLRTTAFACPRGTLYPLLRKLMRAELLFQCREESESGWPRKYYYLTDAGKERLRSLTKIWRRLCRDTETIDRMAIVTKLSTP